MNTYKSTADVPTLLRQQQQCLAMQRAGDSYQAIAEKLGLSLPAVKRRISGAKKMERLDPEIMNQLAGKGITDLAGVHSGWLLEKDKQGSGHSLYFYLGPDEEKLSFVDAVMEVLEDIPRLEPVLQSPNNFFEDARDYANWIALADLHIGGHYGDPRLEQAFNFAIDDLIRRLPPARHAVLFELGDLLEANDHKGVTPGSGNFLEVKLGTAAHLENTMLALKLIRRALYRLLETHDTVEAHFIRGNHDETSFMAVMIALEAHFENNPRIKIVVSADEFRVISWGKCAAFPNHGDKIKWPDLKDVWSDQFSDEWAAAKAHRIIMTAHFHHERKQELVGAVAEHFRTLHGPNTWARQRGMFSRGSLTAMTVHEEWGEENRTISNIRNTHPAVKGPTT